MSATSDKKVKTVFFCAKCGRKLRNGRYAYSRHTGNRYCKLGEGCGKNG